MKRSILLYGLLCAATGFAQTTNPTAAQPAAPSSTQLKARGPEAVAQQDPSRVVATINGKSITAREADALLKAIPPEQLKQYESNLQNVVQQIYMSEELAQQAVKMNLDKESPLKEQLELSRAQILTRAYLNKIAAGPSGGPTQDPQQYYNAHQPEFDRVKLSGIFVSFNPPGTPASSAANSRTEEAARSKADDIEKKLKAGGDFATLARTDSENQQSAARGGEIGTFSVADPQLPPDLRSAVEKLQTGAISEPVRIPNAFLILKADSRSKLTFEQARPEIVQKLQTERSQAAVKQEVDKYKIQVQDPDFFASTAAPANHIPSLARPGSTVAPPSAPPNKP